MKNFIYIIVLFVVTWPSLSVAQVNQNNDRKMAVYLTGEGLDENYQANLVSVQQIISVTGISSIISSDFTECLDYGMIVFGTTVSDNDLSTTQKESLKAFVENGGTVVFPALTDSELIEFSGITDTKISTNRLFLSFKSSQIDKELRWIDEPLERDIKLGGSQFDGIYETIGYRVSDAEVLGLFKDGRAGLIKVKRGSGYVYTFGFDWRNLIIRNLLDRDYQANRGYSNYFEATSDVIMLLVRGIYTNAVPHAVWLSPAPYDSKAVFIITHDVCSHTAHIFSNDFAQMEYERGISATYNITTHQFIDDINGDNYSSHIPQMKLLLHKNHVIGSHSYGHFPDFADGNIFPIGEDFKSLNDYNPHFSIEQGHTVGGTVKGEFGASKHLLEKDLNIDVTMHRSGHLAVNPAQYNILDEMGFKYSSSYTAADVLTGFPYFMHASREMNGEQLPIVEIPLAISDVFGSNGSAIDEFNWMDKAELWRDVTESYANNNALTNILIHPNRKYKLDALVYVLDEMSDDILPYELTHYADFWRAKNQVKFSSSLVGSTLRIYANEAYFNNEAFSFIYDLPNNITDVELYNEQGELVSFIEKEYYLGTQVLSQKSISDFKDSRPKLKLDGELLSQNYPNPAINITNIEYYIPQQGIVEIQVRDIYGRIVMKLVNGYKDAGDYKIEYDVSQLGSGMYFYQIHLQSGEEYLTATRKMMIK